MKARGFFAALVVAFATNSAWADDDAAKKEAQVLFTQGLKQADAGDPRAALASFRGAYDKFPNFRVLYNIGRLCVGLGDGACAVRAYEQYLRDGASDVPAKRRKEVETELEALTAKVANVTITSNVEAADVVVDDSPAGKAPLSLPLNPGPHVVVVTSSGKKAERSVTVAAGDTTTLDIPILGDDPPAPVVETPEAPPEKPAPEPRAQRTIPIVPWAVTGGLALGTIVVGAVAASEYSSFQDKKETFGVTRAELEDAQGSARTLFVVTGVFAAATIVAGGVASYLTWLAPRGARVGIGPGGVVLMGQLR